MYWFSDIALDFRLLKYSSAGGSLINSSSCKVSISQQ